MTETHPQITAGIDVGKAHLELSINQRRLHPNLPNDPEGIAVLTLELARLPEPIALAVYEPTGGCERLLATMLAEAGLPPAGCIPCGCAPRPDPAAPPPLICPPTRPPKPRTPDCAPSSKTCSGSGSSW